MADQLVFPIGLAAVATALEAAGHEPWIVDLNVGGDDPMDRLRLELERFQPQAVGVSLRNIDSTTRKAPHVYHTQLRPTLETIRRVAPGVPTLLGGPGFTQSSRAFMERYPYDFGLKAEAEDSVVELLSDLAAPEKVPGTLWRDEHGHIHDTGERPMPDLAALPFPRRHPLDWELYRREERRRGLMLDMGVETTRGCPRRCAYCNYPWLNGRVLRRKPVQVVLDELEYLAGTFGVRQFTFTDSRFNEDPGHARAICEGIIRRGITMRWIAWLGFHGLEVDFLELMRQAGCFRVAFSPDGLLQPSLDRMRKDTSTAEIQASIEAVRKVRGLKASWSFFCTPPSTSLREQLALLGQYFYLQGSLAGRGRMVLTWCRVEEGTHFETIAREDRLLPPDADLLPDDPAMLDRLFYVPRGFEQWSRFWDRFLDAEMQARSLLGRVTAPLRRFGMKDLTPPHMRRRP